MKPAELKNIVEAALMVADDPLSVNNLSALFKADPMPPDRDDIRQALNALQADYADRGVELKEVAGGFRFQARTEVAEWVNRLFDEKPPRYSQALLETLAIIAYRQPITRAEIEDIRGVGVSAKIIRALMEREWIKAVGHREAPGRPELLATTRQFLDYFNLKKLAELPPLADMSDLVHAEPDLFEQQADGDGDTVVALRSADGTGADGTAPDENEGGPGMEAPEQSGADGAGSEGESPLAEGNVVPFSGQSNTR